MNSRTTIENLVAELGLERAFNIVMMLLVMFHQQVGSNLVPFACPEQDYPRRIPFIRFLRGLLGLGLADAKFLSEGRNIVLVTTEQQSTAYNAMTMAGLKVYEHQHQGNAFAEMVDMFGVTRTAIVLRQLIGDTFKNTPDNIAVIMRGYDDMPLHNRDLMVSIISDTCGSSLQTARDFLDGKGLLMMSDTLWWKLERIFRLAEIPYTPIVAPVPF